jgi:DNA-binding response OmpR family regulator
MPSEEKPTGNVAKSGGGKRILIIEDERPLSHALELKFTHEGFDCTVANNGAEGLKEANTGKFAMILLDLIMPEMDGFTFLQNLKKKTPVIVLSNLGQDEDRARAKELGAKDYMVKSNTPITEIVKVVKTFL